MKNEIYQEIDKLIKDFSLSKEEIDQMYLDEGIINKSLQQQLLDIKKELDNLANRYGMSAESKLLDLVSFDYRKVTVINEMNVYEQKLENIESQLENFSLDDDYFLSLYAKWQEYKNYLQELQQEYLIYQEQDEIDRVDQERYQKLKNKLLDKRDKIEKRLAHPEEKVFSVGIGKRIKEREYPSEELRNRVFSGTIRLAQFYARKYQSQAKGKFTYDDLFQIASEALLSACYYYVPNGNANFFTYASCCIRNRLHKELFTKRRKKTKNFFEQEQYNMSYVEMFLKIQLRRSWFHDYGYTDVGFLREFKNIIAKHNKDMLNVNEASKIFWVGNRHKSESEQYEILVDRISSMLSNGKLQLLLSDDDRRLISELSSYRKVPSSALEPWIVLEYLKTYKRRLENIETYLSIFQELEKRDVSLELFYDEMLKRFNQKIHEFNSNVYRLRKVNDVFLRYGTTYFDEYFDQYGVNFLYNEFFDIGITRGEEIEKIREEKMEELRFDDVYLTEEQEKILDDAVKEELASRKRHVLEMVKEKNEPIYAFNKEKLEDKKYLGKSYRRKYRMQDILEIEKDISILYSDDKSIFDCSAERRKKGHLSVEEQAEVDLFLEDYQHALDELNPIQKDILNLWFDENGIHSMGAKEISSVLGISSKKVYREKEKAIKILQKSSVLQNYRDA